MWPAVGLLAHLHHSLNNYFWGSKGLTCANILLKKQADHDPLSAHNVLRALHLQAYPAFTTSIHLKCADDAAPVL
jgi:hypothetical protein